MFYPLNWSGEAGKEANPVDWGKSKDFKKAKGFLKSFLLKQEGLFYRKKWLS